MLELTKRITHVDASEIHDNLVLPYELRIRGRLRATTETKQEPSHEHYDKAGELRNPHEQRA